MVEITDCDKVILYDNLVDDVFKQLQYLVKALNRFLVAELTDKDLWEFANVYVATMLEGDWSEDVYELFTEGYNYFDFTKGE